MKEVSVIGHFAFGYDYFDGQTVKTKTITNELCKKYGKDCVGKYDTHGGKKMVLKSPFYAFSALKKSKNVIMLPAHNGLRIFGRLLPVLRHFFKNRKIFYAVIGGWLPQKTKACKGLSRSLKKFDGIFVETQTMKKSLEEQGFKNIIIVPNFKNLSPISEKDLASSYKKPLEFCIFSRVMREKGITDAIEVFARVNQKYVKTVCKLDIYGPIEEPYKNELNILTEKYSKFVRYCGTKKPDESVDTLRKYYMLVFPTLFYTEGIPGTIIDALFSGVPVLSAEWESCRDILNEGNSVIYKFADEEDFYAKLLYCIENEQEVIGLKARCLKDSEKYMSENAMKIIEAIILQD